ncbi:hypothetical protein SP39_17 [Salmonella phage 39]|nr:hypothetical protein SP39_17 [Salmonella phage 39]
MQQDHLSGPRSIDSIHGRIDRSRRRIIGVGVRVKIRE